MFLATSSMYLKYKRNHEIETHLILLHNIIFFERHLKITLQKRQKAALCHADVRSLK